MQRHGDDGNGNPVRGGMTPEAKPGLRHPGTEHLRVREKAYGFGLLFPEKRMSDMQLIENATRWRQ